MLTELTAEQEALIPVIRDRWLNKFFSLPRIKDGVEEHINWLYEFCKKKKPVVLKTRSPFEAQLFAFILGNKKALEMVTGMRTDVEFPNGGDYPNSKNHNLPMSLKRFIEQMGLQGGKEFDHIKFRQFWLDNFKQEPFSDYGNIGDFGWVAFYQYFTEIGVVNHEAFNKYTELMDQGIYDMIQLEDYCILIENPVTLHREELQMHSTTEKAIQWADGFGMYFIHGRFVEDKMFTKALHITKEEYFTLQNDEDRMVVHEIQGDNLMNFLDVELKEEKTFVHANGEIETMNLYHTKSTFPFAGNSKGELNQKLAWLEMHCPSTGAKYLKPVCPLWDAETAAKELRPDYITKDVPYSWDQRN